MVLSSGCSTCVSLADWELLPENNEGKILFNTLLQISPTPLCFSFLPQGCRGHQGKAGMGSFLFTC